MSRQTLEEVRITRYMTNKEDCLTIDQATELVGTTRQTLYTYMNVLGIQRYRFPFDRKTYLLKEDAERIKKLFEENRS